MSLEENFQIFKNFRVFFFCKMELAQCEILAESENLILPPIFYSRGYRYKYHTNKIFKFFKYFQILKYICLCCNMEFGNENLMLKELNLKFQLNPITSYSSYFLFQRKSLYLSQEEKFQNFQLFQKFPIFFYLQNRVWEKKGMPNRQNVNFELNPITSYFVLFAIPEDIAVYVTGRKFSKFSNLFVYFAKWNFGMIRWC